ncbi:MAG: CHAT domain-containing protein [Desulfobacteria bacterium]
MNYVDFEVEIEQGSGREYPVAVLRSPAGEARESMYFPFDELALKNHLQALQIALLRSGGKHRSVLSNEEQTVQNFGQSLFDALLTGEVRSRFDVSRQRAVEQGKGLRLKLRIQSPRLAALPWEYIYDKRGGEYLSLSRDTPLIRYLELPTPIQPLNVTLPLRILGMIASPSDLPALDVEREKQRMEEAIRDLRTAGMVDLIWLEGQTWRILMTAMKKGPWHVFHFIGHGGFDSITDEGIIALSNEKGQSDLQSATKLGRLLADHHTLRLAVLNSCEGARGSEHDIFSSTAAILVRRGIPAVLGMQYEITDRAAIEFSRTFYENVADGYPIDMALAEARKAISLTVSNTVEWGTPVLYMRSPDGQLFNVMQKSAIQELTEEEERKRVEAEARQKAKEEERKQGIEDSNIQEKRRWPIVVAIVSVVALIAAVYKYYPNPPKGIIVDSKNNIAYIGDANQKEPGKQAPKPSGETPQKANEKEHKRVNTSSVASLMKGEGYYNAKNYKAALPIFRKAADAGNAKAMTWLGYAYEQGHGVNQDYVEAVRWYRKAADAGYVVAMKNLGVVYSLGQGVKQDYAEAVRWYRKAADAGDALAMNGLGWAYHEGHGVEQDYAEAVRWYRKAADAGDVVAMKNLGNAYYFGQGVKQDYAEAVRWYRKAADAGDADSIKFLKEYGE